MEKTRKFLLFIPIIAILLMIISCDDRGGYKNDAGIISAVQEKPEYSFFGVTNSINDIDSYNEFSSKFPVRPNLVALLLMTPKEVYDAIDGNSLIAVPLEAKVFAPTNGTKPECAMYGNPTWQWSSTRLPDYEQQLTQLFIDKPWLLTKVDFFILGNEMNNQCLTGAEIDEVIFFLRNELQIYTPIITGIEFGQAGLDLPSPDGYPELSDYIAPFNYSTPDPLTNAESNAELDEILLQGKPIILVPPAFYSNNGPYGHSTWFPFSEWDTLADNFYFNLLFDWKTKCGQIDLCRGVVLFGWKLQESNPKVKSLNDLPDFDLANAIMPYEVPQFKNNFSTPSPTPIPTSTPAPVNMVLDITPDIENLANSVISITGAPANTMIEVRYKWDTTGTVDCSSNLGLLKESDVDGNVVFNPGNLLLPPSTPRAFTQDCSGQDG